MIGEAAAIGLSTMIGSIGFEISSFWYLNVKSLE